MQPSSLFSTRICFALPLSACVLIITLQLIHLLVCFSVWFFSLSFFLSFLSSFFLPYLPSFLPHLLLLDLQEEASVCDQQHRSHGRWLRDEKCPRWQPSGMGECSIALIAIVMRECFTDRVIGFNLTPYDWTYSYTYTCKYVHKYTWSHPQTCAYRHTHTNARRQQLLHISNESTVSTFMTE